MKEKKLTKIRVFIAAYIAIVFCIAVSLENIWLALGGMMTGVICMWLVKKKLAVKTTDERTEHIAGQAAKMTYSITVSGLALTSLLFIFLPQNQPYLQSIGIILSYITLTMIGLFAILWRYYLSQES